MRAKLTRIAQFGVAGLVGYVVDASVLVLSAELLGPFPGRGLSFACAVLATWWINRHLAFADRAAAVPSWGEFLRYLLAMIPGSIVNWAGYGITLVLLPHPPALWYLPFAVAVGSLAGMGTNMVAAGKLVFKHRR
ncbi:MAG TPA: GtrA family protein [Devosia sp.]|nr:GtrA family protein [Devosia sp.]